MTTQLFSSNQTLIFSADEVPVPVLEALAAADAELWAWLRGGGLSEVL